MSRLTEVLLKKFEKVAFAPPMPMPPAPGVPADANASIPPPPMDPAMMAQGGGQPMVDPATGQPIDPAMLQAMMAQGGGQPMPPPGVDPATGQPIDPAMMQGMPPPGAMPPQGGPPIDPATGQPLDPAMMAQGGQPMPQDMMPVQALEQLFQPVLDQQQQLIDTMTQQQDKIVELMKRIEELEKGMARKEGITVPSPEPRSLGDVSLPAPSASEAGEAVSDQQEQDQAEDEKRPGDESDKAKMGPFQRLSNLHMLRKTL